MMEIVYKKTIENVALMGAFSGAAYLLDLVSKKMYKTVNFDHKIWNNGDIAGRIIGNGKDRIICRQANDTVFLNDINGKSLNSENFTAFELQVESFLEREYVFGFKNSVYREGKIYQDICCYYSPNKEIITLQEQYDGGWIIWISSDNILYLKNNSIEYVDYNFNKAWDLSFEEMETEKVLTCFDQGRFLFIVNERGRLLKVDKQSGYIVDVFQHAFQGNFSNNYFFRKDGILIFLGHHLYLEISPDNFKILKQIEFSHEDIVVKDSYFDEDNQCIYFYGIYGDSFPNLIGGFDINTNSFLWRYIMKSEGKGNAFFMAPVPVGNLVVTRDRLKNILVFEKVE